ncbi:hypothetical protein Q3W71_05005 [Micromonospora sp. C28SCA-DRY-2]|uniref:hypothetical protein n=1 Tax=Micromonospora sp. C28SCA-DRY-2 TaxID=3059522 RepID=UPI0026760F77|nr:hypothetical protein [Micromonospora sp. C28SCA-DRY-2]MDO3701036.1 hypothetical protein [Micromonospora sp. C28SCA-DRY-2]
MTKQPGGSAAAESDQPVADDPTTAAGSGASTTGATTAAAVQRATGADRAGEAGDPDTADADRDAATDDEPAAVRGPAPVPGAALLALLALGWLAAMLWSTREAITSAAAGVTAISLSAFALPGVISAALVAGAAFALFGVDLLGHRVGDRATLRFLAAIGAGLLIGLATAFAINLTYADNATTNVIAGTSAAAAIIGGAAAGARSAPTVGAVVAAALGTLVFVVAFSRARDPLFDLFGAGGTQESLVNAAKWVSRTESLLAGVVAGLLAFGYLAWARRRAARRDPDAPALRWPAYLAAGAGPGLLLLVAEVIIRVGGRSLLDLAAALSEADAVAQTSLGTSRVDNGIWVLFVGALTALIAFGRTLGPAAGDDDEPVEVTER